MPLMPGKSQKTLSDNIDELMSSYKAKGTIGNITPTSSKKAQQIAAAIAYKKRGQ